MIREVSGPFAAVLHYTLASMIHFEGRVQSNWRTALPVFFILSAILSLSFALPAQQPAPGSMLWASQKEGRRIFQQRCAVCHVPATTGAKTLGPSLYKGVVEGNEETVRATIQNGVGDKMPGFKYGLDSTEIDEVIAYLKTLDKPARAVASERPER
jgi:mono/diheme cytochrome c family protein